jgi:Zn-dependent peptidase ImmA (M78 family)
MGTIDSDVESRAQLILNSFKIHTAPIPIEEVVNKSGLTLLPFDFGNEVSGVLHIKSDTADIGYNPNESKVRQRFTIAHEFGHYILHRNDEKIFIDNENYYQSIMFRSTKLNLSFEDYQREKEANSFAAAILMPIRLVQKELINYSGFDLSDNAMITDLAKKFEVSIQAMSFRIINLANSGKI